jgi:iron complex transport system ATP-binding protein
MGDALIRVEDFSCRIGEREILCRLSFSVAPGEFVCLVGPNGAGKSTLLKCLHRIRTGAGGRIEIAGRPLADYTQKELARLQGYVPQADGRYLPFTAGEFVLMGRYPHLSPFASVREADRRAVAEALQQTGTAALAERWMGSLSGGERQKVLIAAALAQEASVLLLDEPTTFLDPCHQTEILHILRAVNRERRVTVLAVTHDLNVAALLSDRVLALKAGCLAFQGSAAELMRNDVLRRIYDKDFLLIPHPHAGRLMVLPEAVA